MDRASRPLDLRSESTGQTFLVEYPPNQPSELGVADGGPAHKHVENRLTETQSYGNDRSLDRVDELLPTRVARRGARRITSKDESGFDTLEHRKRIAQRAEPRRSRESRSDRRRMKISVHPGADILQERLTRRGSDARERIDDRFTHAETPIVRPRVELREKRLSNASVDRGSRRKGRDPAHGQEFKRRCSRCAFWSHAREAQRQRVAIGSTRHAEAREGIDQCLVRARTWKT